MKIQRSTPLVAYDEDQRLTDALWFTDPAVVEEQPLVSSGIACSRGKRTPFEPRTESRPE